MEFELMKSRQVNHREFVILCYLPGNKRTPWVTWRTSTENGYEDKYWGHYHNSLPDAEEDYLMR